MRFLLKSDVPRVVEAAGIELRKAKRYPVYAPMSFCWAAEGGGFHKGVGRTVDISSRGVAVMCDEVLTPGTQLELEIYLEIPGKSSRMLCFYGEGRVVRKITAHRQPGFAAEVLFRAESTEEASVEISVMIQ